MISDEDLTRVYKNLPAEDRKELDVLHKELDRVKEKKGNDIPQVKDKSLKKRVAKFLLKSVRRTGSDEDDIQATCYFITGQFIGYTFGDSLDGVIDLAGELEMGKEAVRGDVFELFANMKMILEKYIS